MRSALFLAAVIPTMLLGFDEAKLKPITVVGTVIDTGCCMVHDGIGPETRGLRYGVREEGGGIGDFGQ